MADLFAQLEAFDDFLHVGAETVKIFFKIRQHMLRRIAGGLMRGILMSISRCYKKHSR